MIRIESPLKTVKLRTVIVGEVPDSALEGSQPVGVTDLGIRNGPGSFFSEFGSRHDFLLRADCLIADQI